MRTTPRQRPLTALDQRRFPAELRTASVIPRWSVVWTLTRDNVSNHSFYVALYAREIARLIEWPGNVANLMFRALVHDLDETITGDIVSPVKQEIIDGQRASAYIADKMKQRFQSIVSDVSRMDQDEGPIVVTEARAIVKAADKLDALLFLIGERRLGNGVIAPHLPRAWEKCENYWMKLPAPFNELSMLWRIVMVPAIKEHEHNGGFGI